MKEYINQKNKDLFQSMKSPISNKMNQNLSISLNNHLIEDNITFSRIPDNISDKQKQEIISSNKFYFLGYAKLLDDNNLLKIRLQELINKKNEYKKNLNNLILKENKKANTNNNIHFRKELVDIPNNIYISRKRKRRKKSQITYKYKCNFKDCNKKYSSENCLNQHIKLKHSYS